MVKRYYHAVYRPRTFVFGALRNTGGRTVQTVTLIGPDGVPATAHYIVERQRGDADLRSYPDCGHLNAASPAG